MVFYELEGKGDIVLGFKIYLFVEISLYFIQFPISPFLLTQNCTDLTSENQEQQKAIKSFRKRILVLAGAGSGKTKTLIDKIKFYINEKKVAAKNILVIAFGKDAIHEIQDRLIEYTDKTAQYRTELNTGDPTFVRRKYISKNTILSNLTIRTFHGLCYTILKENGAGHFDNHFKVLDDDHHTDASLNTPSAKERVDSMIRKSIISACENDPVFFLKLEQYLIEYGLGIQKKKTTSN